MSGYDYQKAGVMLCELVPQEHVQMSLFERRRDNPQLMATLDRINSLWGRGTVKLAVEGIDKEWSMRRERMSPRYTTCWDELPVAVCA